MISAFLPSVPSPSVRKPRVMMTDALDIHAPAMRNLTILGSTGSIGTNSLDVVRRSRHLYEVYALAAGRNADLLADQILEFRPKVAVAATQEGLDRVASRLTEAGLPRREWPDLKTGEEALVEIAVAPEIDTLVSAIVGVAGLPATYEAVCRGKRVGLANKEVLVSGGKLVMQAVRDHKAELLPIDSEHNGAHQCLRAGNREQVAKLILTASGGPFRNTPKEALAEVTPAQALNHPTWRMGNRITIDSATLMNKGFEVIEACWLFDFLPKDIGVVVHPQSTVHSMVEFKDGSLLAQLSVTDMRLPILYALTYPERIASDLRFPVPEMKRLDFTPPDLKKFPCLRLAYEAGRKGGTAPAILNAANEVAVARFLEGAPSFAGIARVIERTMDAYRADEVASLAQVRAVDAWARMHAADLARGLQLKV